MELSYRDSHAIEGTVAGTAVRLAGRIGSYRGSMRGTWDKATVEVNWSLGDKHTPTSPSPGPLVAALAAALFSWKPTSSSARTICSNEPRSAATCAARAFGPRSAPLTVASARQRGRSRRDSGDAAFELSRRFPTTCTGLCYEGRWGDDLSPLTPLVTTRSRLSGSWGPTLGRPPCSALSSARLPISCRAISVASTRPCESAVRPRQLEASTTLCGREMTITPARNPGLRRSRSRPSTVHSSPRSRRQETGRAVLPLAPNRQPDARTRSTATRVSSSLSGHRCP